MPDDPSALAAIAVIAGVNYASRIAGIVVMSRFRASPRLERFLDGLSISVIAALVASILAQAGAREAMAVLLASPVVLGMRNAMAGLLSGIACAAAWSALV